MCTDISILCNNENKMNKELEELFNQKKFQNFDCNDISKLLWKMNLSKYQQVFLKNNINGEFVNLMSDEFAPWEQMGLEKKDIYKIKFYFEMMKSPGYVLTLSPDYDDECCVCSHNTPEKTIHLLKEYDINVQRDLILKNNLCSPVLTFAGLWKDVLGKDFLSPDGIHIMTEIVRWKNDHKQHLRRLGNKGAKRQLEECNEEERPQKKQKLTHQD